MIVSVQDNEHLHLDTISKFSKSVKDVIHIEGDMLSCPSVNFKFTPSFLAMTAFSDVTSISLLNDMENNNLWYSINNHICKSSLLMKSLLTDLELTAILRRNRVFQIN